MGLSFIVRVAVAAGALALTAALVAFQADTCPAGRIPVADQCVSAKPMGER